MRPSAISRTSNGMISGSRLDCFLSIDDGTQSLYNALLAIPRVQFDGEDNDVKFTYLLDINYIYIYGLRKRETFPELSIERKI